MIQAPAGFTVANASLQKKPVFLLVISTYNRAFSTGPVIGTLYTDLGLGGLCGCFTDGTGQIIGQPFPIGTAYVSLRVPVGATQLQLGLNETILSDNFGAYDVTVNGVPVVVPGTTRPWQWVNGGLNTNFQYDGSSGGTAPVVIAGLTAGQLVTIHYTGGLVGHPGDITDADGIIRDAPGGNPVSADHTFAPSRYMPVSIYPWVTDLSDLKLTVSDMDGGADLADLVFSVQDVLQQITADLSGFVMEGRTCKLYHGFQGLDVGSYLPMFSGVVNTVDSANGNNEYTFTVSSINLKKLTAKIFTVSDPDVNGSTFTTSSKNPVNLNGHPLDILVTALQQAGVPAGSIDTTKIQFYRDTIFNGLTYVFTITSAPTAKDFIENEICKPLGMYLWENNLGLLSINSFYPAMSGNGSYTPPTPPVATLDITNTNDVPLAQESDLITQVIFKFDDDGSGSNFLSEAISTWSVGIAKYGLTDGNTIESRGMKSGFQGFFMAKLVSELIFLRYGLKNLILDPMPAIWSLCVLEPGDIIALTEPFVPDRDAGVLGVTTQTFEVLDRNWKFMSGVVELKLLAIDLSKFKQYLITPNAEANYTAASTLDKGKYMFQSGANGLYSNSVAGNTLG